MRLASEQIYTGRFGAAWNDCRLRAVAGWAPTAAEPDKKV